ncbi:alpha/beta hydrolase [Bacillus shivajii]|uniref:alpha/beta fold hydrolase n=1 Tax=Bacillus shivajii TaxID=1983719 RepID=UPI001CFC4026|nr:alpha/beta hydrolase [Bacillus shivajii]UCZ52746.1 alpha/beta hydrolase [Bacillus shivajii]
MEMDMQQLGNRTLHYARSSGGIGTVIGIHGLTGNHKNLHYYQAALTQDYEFISYDLRGRGNSSEADMNTSIESHAKDLIDFLEALNIKRPIFIGHSMGAYIAATVAAKRKDTRGLVLLDGVAEATEHQRDIVVPSLSRLSKRYDSPSNYVNELKKIYIGLGIDWNPTIEDIAKYEIEKDHGVWKHKSDPEKIRKDFESFYHFNLKEICSQISCKTLLVQATGNIGKYPPLFLEKDFDLTTKYIRKLKTIESDCNHYTMVFQNQPYINREIKKFLQEV